MDRRDGQRTEDRRQIISAWPRTSPESRLPIHDSPFPHIAPPAIVIASAAKQSSVALDCHGASRLAMTARFGTFSGKSALILPLKVVSTLLPAGEGGAQRRMRGRFTVEVGGAAAPHPNPSPGGRGALSLHLRGSCFAPARGGRNPCGQRTGCSSPDSRFPTPDSRFPIPDSRFPIPDSRFPIPDSRALYLTPPPDRPCRHRSSTS